MAQPLKVTPTLEETCLWFDVCVKDVLGKSRMQTISKARNVVMYLLYRNTDMSYSQVGNLFACHHTSVLSAVKRIESNPNWKSDINEILNSAMAASLPDTTKPFRAHSME